MKELWIIERHDPYRGPGWYLLDYRLHLCKEHVDKEVKRLETMNPSWEFLAIKFVRDSEEQG
jgi:hypothetical protein